MIVKVTDAKNQVFYVEAALRSSAKVAAARDLQAATPLRAEFHWEPVSADLVHTPEWAR